MASTFDSAAMENKEQNHNHPRSIKRTWSSNDSMSGHGSKVCVCAPPTHAGSFKCRLHRVLSDFYNVFMAYIVEKRMYCRALKHNSLVHKSNIADVCTISSLVVSSAMHYLLQTIIAEHLTLDNLVLRDADGQGVVYEQRIVGGSSVAPFNMTGCLSFGF